MSGRTTGGRLVVRALEDEDVPFAFGIPGTHNIELYDALAESERVRPVLVTDEQSASFMADGVWRASQRLACANLVPGAGLTHAMSGIAEAFLDNVPMLVLGCGIRRDTGAAYQLHDVDQVAMVAPVTKAALRVERGEDLYGAVRRACRIARDGAPGPVFLEVPANLYLFRHDASERVVGEERQAAAGVAPDAAAVVGSEGDGAGAPDAEAVRRATELLTSASRPLLYLGHGARRAGPSLVRLAEALEAPVATTIQGKGVFPESHPLFLWPGFGAGAPPFVREVVSRCDATLAIGCRFGEVATASYGGAPPQPLVHVDIDPAVPGRNHATALAVTADGAAFVEALLGRLTGGPRPDPALRARIATGHEEVRRDARSDGGERVSPARLLEALQRQAGPEAIFTTDSGNGTFLGMELLRLEAPGRFLAPVDYSCMGYAVPAAIGARLARPEAPVIALPGDGAFLMTGLELLTAARERAPVAVFVMRDRELAQIAQFQDMALGRKSCSELPDYDLEALGRGVGAGFLRLESDDGIDSAVADALAAVADGGPVVVDVAIDYSRKTWFTRGVVSTNFHRLPWGDRLRFAARALGRRVLPR